MSHQVTVSVSLSKYDKEEISLICQEAIQKIEAINNLNNEGVKKFLIGEIKRLKEIEKNKDLSFSTTQGNEKNAIENFKDQLIKNVSNLLSSITNEKIYSSFEFSERNELNISSWINNYGNLFIKAVEVLKNEGKNLTDENISKIIDKIVTQNADEEFKNKATITTINDIETKFSQSKKIKFFFKNNLNKLNNYQELNEFNIYLNSKEYTYKKMLHLEKIVATGLKAVRSYFLQGEIERDVDQFGNFFFIYHFKNKANETFDLRIDENLIITYKIGDYKDHCCEQTSSKLWEYLKEHKVNILSTKIIRSFTNQKPLYKSISKIKEKAAN